MMKPFDSTQIIVLRDKIYSKFPYCEYVMDTVVDIGLVESLGRRRQ